MNLGIIAHNSKKVLIEDFCIAYKNILYMKFMPREPLEEGSRRLQTCMCINFLQAA